MPRKHPSLIMTHSKLKYLLLIMSFFISITVFSQQKDTLDFKGKKPKVGLVLSGGGAKGLAHIGVLKVLEEEGVHIDFIGGTSMGAMIGGLYASGYTASQLDSIFKKVDFDVIVQDNLPRRVKSFYDKESDEKYSITFPFKNMKFGLPVAFSKGQNTYNLFSQLLYHVRFVEDFNKLPIPFLCIATDIETGEEVILNKGNLVSSILASGSLPGLFYPLEIDGRYLSDGGIVNNYPVEEIRKLDADIIIGVDVQTGFMNRDQLTSAAKLVMQIVNFQMLTTMKDKKEKTDIYIKPNITDFNVVSFADGDQIIQKGITAAENYREQFRQIAEVQGRSQVKIPLKPEKMMKEITSIEIQGSDKYSRAYVLGKLRIKQGDIISFPMFAEGLERLNATQNFKSITYDFKPDLTNENNDECEGDELHIKLEENHIKTFFRFGLHYNELYKSGLLLNLTHKNIIAKNDVFSADLVLGDNVRYQIDYYLDNGFYWSFGFRSRFNQLKALMPANLYKFLPNYQGRNKFNITYFDFTHQAYLQTIFRQVFTVGAGLEYKYLDINSESIMVDDVSLNDIYKSSDFWSVYGFLTLDTFDKKHFPKKGIYFNGSYKAMVKSKALGKKNEPYSITQGTLGLVKTYFDKLTFRIDNEVGFTVGNSGGMLDFLLGGYGYNTINNFSHFYGYDFLSISGDSYIKGAVGFDIEVYRKNHFNFYANFANVGDDIYKKTSSWFSKPTYTGYAFGYGMETLIGPIEVKYSWSPETNATFWWVNLGFWF